MIREHIWQQDEQLTSRYSFPSGPSVYISLSSCPSLCTRPPSLTLSCLSSLVPSASLLRLFLILSYLPSLRSLSPAIPAVVKAMVFCGGSWLGLICQAADLPSLLSSSSSLSLALLPFYPVIRWSKEE